MDLCSTKPSVLFISLVLLALLAAPAHSMKISSYSISSEIVDEDTVYQKMIVSIQNDGNESLVSASISVPPDSKILSVSDTYGSLKYEVDTTNVSGVSFELSKPINPEESRMIMVDIQTDRIVKNIGDYFEYLLVFTPKYDVSGFEHFLKLPEGAELFSPKGFSVVFPEAETSTTNGITTVIWKEDLQAGGPVVFLARYKKAYTDWIFIGTTAIILIGASVFARIWGLKALKKWNMERKTGQTMKSLNLLNEREKAVAEIIIKNKGIKQSEIMQVLGYRKSSMSKIISRLEARRIIERKKYGKINKLYPGEKLANN